MEKASDKSLETLDLPIDCLRLRRERETIKIYIGMGLIKQNTQTKYEAQQILRKKNENGTFNKMNTCCLYRKRVSRWTHRRDTNNFLYIYITVLFLYLSKFNF